MAWKSQYANELGLHFRGFWTNETQQLREGQLVGRMLLQRLATGATAVKQARYRRGPTRGSETLYAHAQYNTRSISRESPGINVDLAAFSVSTSGVYRLVS